MSEPWLTLIKWVVDSANEAKKSGLLDNLPLVGGKPHRVLVLGSTGAGKSNLLGSLRETIPEAIHAMSRTEFVKREKIRLKRQPFTFVDTPGQQAHKPRRIDAIRDAMKPGTGGIINVVSYGYHESRTGIRDVFDDNRTVREEFLERQRAVEIAALDEWKALLGHPETAGWLITVVSKADLWWDRHEEVMEHYQSGPYFDALGDATTLKPVVVPYCSVFHKFYGEGPLSGVFDDADRQRLREDLIVQLLAAVSEKRDGR